MDLHEGRGARHHQLSFHSRLRTTVFLRNTLHIWGSVDNCEEQDPR